MNNVIQFPGQKKGNSSSTTPANISGIPIFRGKIDYEELEQDLDFANFLCFVFRQLPDKSRREFLRGMCMIQDVVERVVALRDPELSKLIVEMGFAVAYDKDGNLVSPYDIR